MNWFVTPEKVRLPLSDGQWIDIKKQLNTGETQEMYRHMRDASGVIDTSKIRLAKVSAYFLDWSLTDRSVPDAGPIEDSLKNMHPLYFGDLFDAVLAHEKSIEAEYDEAKKLKAGETPSSAISASAA